MKFKTLLAVIILSFTFLSNAFAAGGFMQVANVTKIQGKAFINKEKIVVGAEIAEGMELNIPKSRDYVEVKFQNGHLVRFTGTKIKVETLNPKNTQFYLIKGKIFSEIKPLTENETFHVKTMRANFAVHGTKFMIEESKRKSNLFVSEGVVTTKSAKGEVEVKKDEELSLATAKDELKAVHATKSMIKKTNAVFSEMGIQ